MRTTEVKIYKFSELKPKIKEKVLENERQDFWQFQSNFEDIAEYVTEWALEKLKEQKIENIGKVEDYWNFGYPREFFFITGDFKFKGVEFEVKPKDQREIDSYEISPSGYYKEHDAQELLDADKYYFEQIEEENENNEFAKEMAILAKEELQLILDEFTTLFDNIMNEAEKACRSDIEYRTSDEGIAENLEDYAEFTENGDRW